MYGRGAPMRQQDTRDSFKLRHRPGTFRSYKRTIADEKKRPYGLNTVVIDFMHFSMSFSYILKKKLAPLGSLGCDVPQVLVSHPLEFYSDSEISSILSSTRNWGISPKQVRLPKIRRKKTFIQFSS